MTLQVSETTSAHGMRWAGAASAAGVLCELHGRPFNASILRRGADDATGLDGVVDALRQLGLKARAERCSAYALGDLSLPVLALMDGGRLVLVLRADDQAVLLCATQRPALQSVTMRQFLQDYAGQVVRIETASARMSGAARRFGLPAQMQRWFRAGTA